MQLSTLALLLVAAVVSSQSRILLPETRGYGYPRGTDKGNYTCLKCCVYQHASKKIFLKTK